ncbi:hypothetical protein BD413DRAFT_478295, partial [Trametes elegans]
TSTHIASLATMPIRDIQLSPLDTYIARPISPGGSNSAGDIDMASPTAWASLPDRPRTCDSRRPSFSVSHAPNTIPQSAWRVQPGQYIAFSIDKDAAAAAAGYEDGSMEQQAITSFPVGRFIGLVVGSYVQRADDDSRWLEELVVMYVGHAPPTLAGTEGLCMPIAPFPDTAGSQCPLPLRTTGVFPVKDCLQYTTFGTRLQIQTLHESKLSFDVDEDEFSRFELQLTTDNDELREQLKGEGVSAAHKAAVEKMRPPPEPLPAVVWRDIRGEHGEDPAEFVTQIYALDR